MGSLGNLLAANGMGWGILQLLPLVDMLKILSGAGFGELGHLTFEHGHLSKQARE